MPNGVEARAILANRLTSAEALKLVAIMLDARGRLPNEPPDSEGYIRALAGRLQIEPRMVAIACCDPQKGLMTEIFVKPQVADIVRWCDREAQWLHKIVDDDRREQHARATSREPEVDRSDHETLEQLLERYGPTFGLRRTDALDVVRGEAGDDDEEAARKREQQLNAEALEQSNMIILREYASYGIEPIKSPDGMLVSLSLARLVNEDIARKVKEVREQRKQQQTGG
jgi:hypothetical protein